eukprot:COSAG05_NODE_11538_length_508_cov_1.508557_1_plen_150_part_01
MLAAIQRFKAEACASRQIADHGISLTAVASVATANAGDGDQAEPMMDRKTFDEKLEEYWSRDSKTAKKLKCKMNNVQLNWYGLYYAVQSLGGYQATVERGSRGWCKALRDGCPENGPPRGKLVHEKYESILLPFEEELKEQSTHQTIDLK